MNSFIDLNLGLARPEIFLDRGTTGIGGLSGLSGLPGISSFVP